MNQMNPHVGKSIKEKATGRQVGIMRVKSLIYLDARVDVFP